MMLRLALAGLSVVACTMPALGAEQRVAAKQHVRTSARHADKVEMAHTHEAWARSVEVVAQPASSVVAPSVHSAWEGELAHGQEDIFAHVRPLIEHQERHRDSVASMSLVETGAKVGAMAQAGVGKVHAFCEICILIMQMKERGQPHLCAGLNPDYFISVRCCFGCWLLLLGVCVYVCARILMGVLTHSTVVLVVVVCVCVCV